MVSLSLFMCYFGVLVLLMLVLELLRYVCAGTYFGGDWRHLTRARLLLVALLSFCVV